MKDLKKTKDLMKITKRTIKNLKIKSLNDERQQEECLIPIICKLEVQKVFVLLEVNATLLANFTGVFHQNLKCTMINCTLHCALLKKEGGGEHMPSMAVFTSLVFFRICFESS